MSNNVITIRKETAQDFLPADMHMRGAIDLHELSKLAKDAMEGSERSLEAAGDIADSNVISRLWHSGEMQKHIIQSISYLGDISKVNLGLSAICNDLAAANLEHASRIDKNHHATNQQLNQVQQLTGELLTHLRKPREPALLERLLPALSKASLTDHDQMRGWLLTLTEEIDLQYIILQENLDKLSKQNDYAVETVAQFRTEITSLSGALTNQKADAVQQLGLLSSRLSASLAEIDQKVDKNFVTMRQTYELSTAVEKQMKLLQVETHSALSQNETRIHSIEETTSRVDAELERKISGLTREMTKRHTDNLNAMQIEKEVRIENQKALIKFIKEREDSIRTTIGEQNQHLLKRILWGAGGIVVLQVLGFGFLAFKMGLFN
jgi:hypothetical protein